MHCLAKKGHLVNNDLFFIKSNILRGQILHKPSAWQRPTQPLKFCINQLVLHNSYYLFITDAKREKDIFCVFLLSCNLSLVSWYVGSTVDKLVKIQGRETETEKNMVIGSIGLTSSIEGPEKCVSVD